MTAFVAPLPPRLRAMRTRALCRPRPSSRMTVALPSSPSSAAELTPAPSGGAAAAPALEEPVTLIDGVEEYLAAVATSADRLVVLKIFAPWCRSCRALTPKVNRLAREMSEVSFYKMDYEKNKELCYRLGVSSMPTFVFYYGAAGEIDKFSCGPMRAQVIREKIDDFQRGSCAYPA